VGIVQLLRKEIETLSIKMFSSAKKAVKRMLGYDAFHNQVEPLHSQMDDLKILSSKILIDHMKAHGAYSCIHEVEFKVFSQFGDDGIIQYLIHNAEVDVEKFVEFGVENYSESNTRFLLMNNNWKGLVMDASQQNIQRIKSQEYYWKHDLTAVHCWVDRENINAIICENGFSGSLGLLSIDIDGNDYWIWESLDAVIPVIVIVEYNSVFGDQLAIAIPYDRGFNRTKAHYSNLYWGASLRALCMLAEKKGYVFVGSNSGGNNAYFVKKDKIGKIRPCIVEEGYVESRFRDSRDAEGGLTFLAGEERLKTIEDMPVYDLETKRLVKIKDLNGADTN
jgi:hypothetical protein